MAKLDIYKHCSQKLQSQLDELQSAIDKVQESIEGEQSSTAGNKFETARAMGHEELNRLNRQLFNLNHEMTILNQIDASKPCKSVQLGALIETDKKMLYLAIALGKIEISKKLIYAVSVKSPIGQAIIGKMTNDEIIIGNKKERIISIY
ncbi:GreA/GreB family elongation factor [Bacteroidia bacterium]|nr:GreA/GreB family elongation factor [Bacteroidia bacterium]